MSEDAAFIRALQDAPQDETTRLVYADWLDERDDPRGAFLRREAEWAAFAPDDSRHPDLYREVSRLAAGLDAEWFAAVSHTGHLVRQACARLAPHMTSTARPNIPREWIAAVAELPPLLEKALAPGVVERRFCVPIDFVGFQTVVGGMTDGPDAWCDLRSAAGVVGINQTHCGTYRRSGPFWDGNNLPSEQREIWLEVGTQGDMHWYFVCCDLDSPDFGSVAEGEDYHPWMSGAAGLASRGRTFLQFLTGHLRNEFADE